MIKKISDVLIQKCLENTYDMPNVDIKQQLQELKEFYFKGDIK